MNHEGFKRFRRRASKGHTIDGLPTGNEPQNLPARIEDEWALLPAVTPATGIEVAAPLVNLHRDDPATRAFDLLRTRLLQALREHGMRRVAIAAPTAGCGATFTAVNLALSLARIPQGRTVLVDLNLRSPEVGAMLGVEPAGDLREFLRGERGARDQFLRMGTTLALGLSAEPDKDAAERLHDARTVRALDRMVEALRPEVVLFDLPAVLEHDDLAAFLPAVDAVLLVADGTSTTAAHIAACERIIDGQVPVLGVVLNRARKGGSEAVET